MTDHTDKAVERLALVGHARDLENYLAGTLLERPNLNATRLLGQLADAIETLEAQLDAHFRALESFKAALTPNAETEAAYIGEFQFVCGEFTPNVPWTCIKQIMAAIRAFAARASETTK